MPKIIQIDNSSEYNNNLFAEFCDKYNIQHINSSSLNPQTNGVVEVVHKEIRQYVLMIYSEYNNNFDLKDVILEAINIHKHKIHSSTGYRTCDIINNTKEDIQKRLLENIENSLKINSNNYNDIKEGDKVLINQFLHHSWKKLVVGKFKPKDKIFKLSCTILNNYGGGLLVISIDVDNYEFNKGEEYLVNSKLCTLIYKEKYDKIICKNAPIKIGKKKRKIKQQNFFKKFILNKINW